MEILFIFPFQFAKRPQEKNAPSSAAERRSKAVTHSALHHRRTVLRSKQRAKRWRTCYFIVNLSVAHKTALSKVTNYQPARTHTSSCIHSPSFRMRVSRTLNSLARRSSFYFTRYHPIGETENRLSSTHTRISFRLCPPQFSAQSAQKHTNCWNAPRQASIRVLVHFYRVEVGECSATAFCALLNFSTFCGVIIKCGPFRDLVRWQYKKVHLIFQVKQHFKMTSFCFVFLAVLHTVYGKSWKEIMLSWGRDGVEKKFFHISAAHLFVMLVTGN